MVEHGFGQSTGRTPVVLTQFYGSSYEVDEDGQPSDQLIRRASLIDSAQSDWSKR